ncbi:MAG TPA: DUF6328 family protein, partial [Fimbriimonadaceae bacterium]|nr:DUF6328 family protein [Fimbriimonadaceae bacterium]
RPLLLLDLELCTSMLGPLLGARMGEAETDIDKRSEDSDEHPEDLSDLLQELRILFNGVQVLTGFLVVLPFTDGFKKLGRTDSLVYMCTFVFGMLALIFFAAPAAQHRLMRPLPDRRKFKNFATWMAISGLVPLSLCLVCSAYIVANVVLGSVAAVIVPGTVLLFIAALWWAIPMSRKARSD